MRAHTHTQQSSRHIWWKHWHTSGKLRKSSSQFSSPCFKKTSKILRVLRFRVAWTLMLIIFRTQNRLVLLIRIAKVEIIEIVSSLPEIVAVCLRILYVYRSAPKSARFWDACIRQRHWVTNLAFGRIHSVMIHEALLVWAEQQLLWFDFLSAVASSDIVVSDVVVILQNLSQRLFTLLATQSSPRTQMCFYAATSVETQLRLSSGRNSTDKSQPKGLSVRPVFRRHIALHCLVVARGCNCTVSECCPCNRVSDVATPFDISWFKLPASDTRTHTAAFVVERKLVLMRTLTQLEQSGIAHTLANVCSATVVTDSTPRTFIFQQFSDKFRPHSGLCWC